MAEVKRASRVAERLREELAGLLLRDVRDPGAAGAIVSRVEVTDDLKLARVYVRALEGPASGASKGEDDPRVVEMLAALKRASPMLRREVTKRLALRFAPDFRFFYDDHQDAMNRIEALLDEVKKDRST